MEAAEVENPTGTMIVEKASECNRPSPIALHAADGSEATETDDTSVDVDPMAVGSTLEGSEATEAAVGISAEVDLMAVGNTLATKRKSTHAVDVVHAAIDGTSAEVDLRAMGGTLAAECNTPSTGADDVVNAASVEGLVDEGAKADTIKVGEAGGGRARRGERVLRWAKAKLKSGAEWMMLDPDVVRRILKSGGEWVMSDSDVVRRILKKMFVVVVDSVVNQAFKGNTVAFKFCAILISELKRCM